MPALSRGSAAGRHARVGHCSAASPSPSSDRHQSRHPVAALDARRRSSVGSRRARRSRSAAAPTPVDPGALARPRRDEPPRRGPAAGTGADTGAADREPIVRREARPRPGHRSTPRASTLTAEYDVTLSLNFGTPGVQRRLDDPASGTTPARRSTALELNTIAARLGVDEARRRHGRRQGRSRRRSTTRRSVVPLGGILGAGQSVEVTVAYAATLRSSLSGSNWLFTRTNGIVDAHRWIPWISRNVPFDRPNHGDPFVTPVSPRVRVAITSDRALVYATTGERVANERPDDDVRGPQRPRLRVHGRARLQVDLVDGRRRHGPRLLPAGLPGVGGPAQPRSTRSRRWSRSSGRTRTRRTTSPRPPAATAWSRRA